jgi:hypothetical protein
MRNGPRIIVNSDVLAPAALALLNERGADGTHPRNAAC